MQNDRHKNLVLVQNLKSLKESSKPKDQEKCVKESNALSPTKRARRAADYGESVRDDAPRLLVTLFITPAESHAKSLPQELERDCGGIVVKLVV